MGKTTAKTTSKAADKTADKQTLPSLEENFAMLEEVMTRLENPEVSLEDAFTEYSRGMLLLKQCNEQIDRVEKKVLKLSEDGMLEELD